MNTRHITDDYGTMTDDTTLVIQRWLPGPADRIWRYLTEEDLRRKWLASGQMRLVADAPFTLVWRNDDLCHAPDHRGPDRPEEESLQSRVIAVTPGRELTIAWGHGDVTFLLEPQGDRVLLTVTHRGLSDPRTRNQVAAGWHTHLDILVAQAMGKAGPSFWAEWNRLHDDYAVRLAR